MLSPTFTDALRRRGGLKTSLPVPVLDVRHVKIDESRVTAGLIDPHGLRVDVIDERLAATAWRKVRIPNAMSTRHQEELAEVLAEWLVAVQGRAEEPEIDELRLATQRAVLETEVAIFRLNRLIEAYRDELDYSDFDELTRLSEILSGQIASLRPRRSILAPTLLTIRAVLGLIAAAGSIDWAVSDGSDYLAQAVDAVTSAIGQMS